MKSIIFCFSPLSKKVNILYASGAPLASLSLRVIRKITDDDRKYYYKDRQFDEEAWQDIVEQGLAGN